MPLVILDVDGTLVDSQNIIVAALEAAFEGQGLAPPSRARALSIVGLSLPEAFTALVGSAGPVEALTLGYRQAFQRLRADPGVPSSALYPGVAEALDAFEAAGARLGLATGKSRRGVAHLLEAHGWEGRFATIQTADDAPSKPHPAMIERAMREAGAGAAETAMIGDTTFDALMSRAAGVAMIGVSWGYHPVVALRVAGAARIIDRFEDAPEALRALGVLPGLASGGTAPIFHP